MRRKIIVLNFIEQDCDYKHKCDFRVSRIVFTQLAWVHNNQFHKMPLVCIDFTIHEQGLLVTFMYCFKTILKFQILLMAFLRNMGKIIMKPTKTKLLGGTQDSVEDNLKARF